MALKNILLNNKLIFIVIILFCILQFIKSDTEVNNYLLNSTGLVPLHYDVKIKLDFTRNVLFGECNITIKIPHKMTNISIPSTNFGIFKIGIINNNNRMIHVPRYSFINETHIYIDFANTAVYVLSPGTYIVQMIYFRNIFDAIVLGYEEERGLKTLTETGVEIIKAQQIFPCWDEPMFESTFNISIMHHIRFKVLSNMFMKREEYMKNENNMMWTHFDKSPFMSSQHLTIVITTFTNIFQQSHTLRLGATIWCRKSITENIGFRHHIGFAQIIIEHVFRSLYDKNHKLDYVAILDVQHSNIETQELILHREEDIIYIETLDSIARKIKVANFLTHQLVSLFWFNYVSWPIEGFVTYLTAYILGKLSSVSYIRDLFVVQVLQESLRFDIPSYNYNPTLHNSNDSDVKINKTFLNYIKPSVLWCILQYILNEDIWNNIRTYIDKYKQSIVKTDDLSHILIYGSQFYAAGYASIDKEYIKQYINNWIKKNYYPVVYAEFNATDDTMSFSYLSSHYINEDMEQISAFVTFTVIQRKLTFNNTFATSFWLTPQQNIKRNVTRIYDVFDEEHYCVIVNIGQTGYYRVNYNSKGWLRLAYCFSNNYTVDNYTVTVLTQAQVIDDAFHFLIHRQLNTTMFWDIISFLSENANYVAWYPMIKAFEYIACVFSLTINIMAHMSKILHGVLQIIGYDEKQNESDLTKCLREEVIKWACIIDVVECRETATFQLIKDLENPVPENRFTWKEWKYCKGLMSANFTTCYNTWEKWLTTSDNRILDYLTCCNDPSFVIFYLNQTIEPTEHKYFIKEQDKRVNIILLTVAKHVKDFTVFEHILNCLTNMQLILSENWQIAILIISITHIHTLQQFLDIRKFARLYLKENRLIFAIRKKIGKRKMEYAMRITKYGSLIEHNNN